MTYTPSPWNRKGERWTERVDMDDGSYAIIRHGPTDPVDDTEYSELLHQIQERIKELGCEDPTFLERLQRAERELFTLHVMGVEWLKENGLPEYMTQADDVWDDDSDWRRARW